MVEITPSQTVGPFYGYALPFAGGGDVAPAGHPGAIVLHGCVYDGDGAPIPDAVVETWQAAPDGSRDGMAGSMRRDPTVGSGAPGGFIGRNGVDFTGFARVATDASGRFAVRTLAPGGVPYVSVCVFARGLTHHLFTRAYLVDHPLYGDGSGVSDGEGRGGASGDGAVDALRAGLSAERRSTLDAVVEREGVYRFDIRLQGEAETVFLEFG